MKTDKFTDMIEAFECDFLLVKDGRKEILPRLQELIDDRDERIMKDIDLLAELSWLLRNGQAEIILKEESFIC